jgi:Fur family transcriptional regulator, zinc uptake regulator
MTQKNIRPAEQHADLLARAAAECKSRGVMLSSIRRDVLSLLAQHDNGLKAYDLLEEIKKQRPNATPPTVYRALDFLVAQGFVHKLELLSQFVVCRHTSHDLPGIYMVCSRCRSVSDLRDEHLAQRLAESVGHAGHRLDSPDIEISTVCADCLG